MPTLQDVAKKAGVSTATVSKVLSNTPYVSQHTREKVLEVVRELGYRPNLAARALSSGKTHIIAVVFPYVYDAIFKDPLVMSILEGIESATTERGYSMLLSTPHLVDGSVDDNFQQVIQSGYIEGMIAIDNIAIASVSELSESFNIPTVSIGHPRAQYWVRCDDLSGGEMLLNTLYERGHREIGIITINNKNNLPVNDRMQGIRNAALEHGLDYEAFPVAFGDFSTRGGNAAAAQLIEHHPELTAIIAINDRMAIGAMQYLLGAGLRVPDDVSVIGYDNIGISAISTPALTTIDQHAVELGRHAAEMLFDVLNNNEPSPVVLSPELIERQSTAAPR